MMTKKFEIQFGALCPPLSQQIVAAGSKVPSDVDLLQQDADEISRLYIRGLLSDSESTRARKRLMARIVRNVSKANGGTDEKKHILARSAG